jgi:hypothetical protein
MAGKCHYAKGSIVGTQNRPLEELQTQNVPMHEMTDQFKTESN